MQKNVIQNDLHTQVPRSKSEVESRKKDDVMVRDKKKRGGADPRSPVRYGAIRV